MALQIIYKNEEVLVLILQSGKGIRSTFSVLQKLITAPSTTIAITEHLWILKSLSGVCQPEKDQK